MTAVAIGVAFFLGGLAALAITAATHFGFFGKQKQKATPLTQKVADIIRNSLIIKRVEDKSAGEPLKEIHSTIFVAGDAVLATLPIPILNFLQSSTVSTKLRNWFYEGDPSHTLAPERVRAAAAVVVITMTLENWMQDFGDNRVVIRNFLLDEHEGYVRIARSKFSFLDLAAKIRKQIEIEYDQNLPEEDQDQFDRELVALAIWEAFMKVLYEGKVRIRGLQAVSNQFKEAK